MSVTLNATLKGPLFSKKIDSVVKERILVRVFDRVGETIANPSKKAQKRLGFRRNKLTPRKHPLVFEMSSTLAGPPRWKKPRKSSVRRRGTPRPGWQEKVPDYNPRRTGKSWQAMNENRARKIIPNALRKYTAEAVAEMNG